MGGIARMTTPSPMWNYSRPEIHYVAGNYGRNRLFGMAGVNQKDIDFDSFFTHILAHEITHGLGPHITKNDGKDSTPRQDLKEAYSTIEEAKATWM